MIFVIQGISLFYNKKVYSYFFKYYYNTSERFGQEFDRKISEKNMIFLKKVIVLSTFFPFQQEHGALTYQRTPCFV